MPPVDYNFSHNELTGMYSTIDVDPDQLWRDRATALEKYISTISGELNNISNLWDGLKIGWMGRDATTAQEFIDSVKTSLVALFGKEGQTNIQDMGPDEGSLVKIQAGIKFVAKNYGEAENSVWAMFHDLAASLTETSTGDNSGGARDNHDGPVIETNPRL